MPFRPRPNNRLATVLRLQFRVTYFDRVEFKPGQIVPQSELYRITREPQHPEMPHEVTVIKGPRFPTCRHSKEIAT